MARRRSLWENAVVSLSPFLSCLSGSGCRSWVALRLVSHGIKTAVSHTLAPPPTASPYGSSERLSGLLEALSGVCDSVSVPLCCLGYWNRGGLPWKQVGGSPPFLFDQFSPVSWKAREVRCCIFFFLIREVIPRVLLLERGRVFVCYFGFGDSEAFSFLAQLCAASILLGLVK